ncbi:MAG: hypothetical protein J6B94_09305 [Lachnospiraceae bacterium]|nr:hypothetical protein [Lachnospiraceae bacterium]
MTLIDIRRTTEILVSLAQAERKYHQFYEEAGQNDRQLGNLSGMHLVRRSLEHIMEDMQEGDQVLNQMIRCLEITCQTFEKYEEEITEYAEESGCQYGSETILKAVEIPENIFRLLR